MGSSSSILFVSHFEDENETRGTLRAREGFNENIDALRESNPGRRSAGRSPALGHVVTPT
jgi:hypothetical protein